MSNEDIQKAFHDDQQGYMYADALKIMANGNQELLTDMHIEAIRAENRDEYWANVGEISESVQEFLWSATNES